MSREEIEREMAKGVALIRAAAHARARRCPEPGCMDPAVFFDDAGTAVCRWHGGPGAVTIRELLDTYGDEDYVLDDPDLLPGLSVDDLVHPARRPQAPARTDSNAPVHEGPGE